MNEDPRGNDCDLEMGDELIHFLWFICTLLLFSLHWRFHSMTCSPVSLDSQSDQSGITL